MKKETLKFKRGIYKINFPFLLSDLSPWQNQMEEEMRKVKGRYRVGKSAWWGFEISEAGASITCYKS
jgi:hypothetical protein